VAFESLMPWRRRPPRVASSGDRPVYAVGDIHGCVDLLTALLARIESDAARLQPRKSPALVFLGDYVDRGPDSRGVIDVVLSAQAEGRFEVRALKGNHEEALLGFLADADFGPVWADFGGQQTLQSYGVPPPSLRSDIAAWERAREALGQALPPEHLTFLSGLELTCVYGDYVFVHAGVRPGVRLADQAERDLLWIRDEFLYARGPFEGVVVHGHTPEAEPFVGDNRIGIDTGAYATGVLTAIRLLGAERVLLQARR
jgi:serine/threonine protein phosphatase 1